MKYVTYVVLAIVGMFATIAALGTIIWIVRDIIQLFAA